MRLVVSHSSENQNPEVVPDSHRAQPHIEIGKADPKQTQPRPEHVTLIETRNAAKVDVDPASRSRNPPIKWRNEWQPKVYPPSRTTLIARTIVPTPIPK